MCKLSSPKHAVTERALRLSLLKGCDHAQAVLEATSQRMGPQHPVLDPLASSEANSNEVEALGAVNTEHITSEAVVIVLGPPSLQGKVCSPSLCICAAGIFCMSLCLPCSSKSWPTWTACSST